MTEEATTTTSEAQAPESSGVEGALRELAGAIRDLVRVGTEQSAAQIAATKQTSKELADELGRTFTRQARYVLGGVVVAIAALTYGAVRINATNEQMRAVADRQAGTTQAVGEIAHRLDQMQRTTEETLDTVEEAKAEVAAAPKLEVTPPARPGGAPKVALVIQARPAKPATAATPSAAAMPSSAPAPAVSIPLSLPAGTTGGGP